jgi:predicted permease
VQLVAGFRRLPDEERDMRDEMQFHVDMQATEFVGRGMSPRDARRAALVAFGGQAWTEAARDELRSRPLESLARDFRIALRGLRAHPGFALSTIVTIGLGIAASVTVFAFVESIFLRPLPVRSADRLVRVYLGRTDGRLGFLGTAGAEVLREHRDVFDAVAADDARNVVFVRSRGALSQQFVSFVSAEFFPMLGLQPRLGRFFSAAEDSVPDRDAVAVISSALWHNQFAADPRVIGEHVGIAGREFTIVGVGPEAFDGVGIGETPSQIWLPTRMMGVIGAGCAPHRPCQETDVLARLSDGVSLSRAQAAVGTFGRALSLASFGDDSVRRALVLPARGVVRAEQRRYESLSRLLIAIAGVLLLIACANLSGLLLARGVSREREVALRRALGASRGRIVQQLLSESLLIGLAGGILGLMLSMWTVRGLMGFFASDEEGFPHFFQIGVDARIVLFAIAVSIGATILFGVLPALATARADAADVLKNATGGAARGRARFGLVAAQVALTSALLSGAALLSRSFVHLLHAQRFDSDHVALFRVRPAAVNYDPERAQAYVRLVRDRIAALPDVESVAFARGSGLLWSGTPWHAGIGATPGDSATDAETHSIAPGFFSTLRIPVLGGREFGEPDGKSAPPVAMVSEALARRLWPRGNALGHDAFVHGRAFRIVGIVPDYRIQMSGEATPLMAFVPFWQNALGPEKDARFAVRLRGEPAKALRALERVAANADPNVPVAEAMTMSAQVDALYPQIHLGQVVLIGAATLALFLSAIGLYGTIAFLVARRTREIGIRIALGARPGDVVWRFMRQGLVATTAGLASGLIAARAGAHLLSNWLVGVPPGDVVAFAIAATAVAGTALLACSLPARRAADVDPIIALRAE